MKRPTAKPGVKRDYILVFGAAVRKNGRPSAALRRRITSAAAWAKANPQSIVIPTGAAGENGPPEAEVIKTALVEGGVSARRIVVEPKGRDTLESVKFCHQILQRRGDYGRIVCCTSRYHQPRCALLLRMLGYEVVNPPAPVSRGRLGRLAFAEMYLRELAAIPYDALLLLLHRKARNHRAD